MTKPRDPLSFGMAITQIIDLIGWARACRTVRRANRTVRHWSESDKKGSPTLEQALALDTAYIAAGGDRAPILESYAMQMEIALGAVAACHVALVEDIAAATQETADAIAHSIKVTLPGAAPHVIYRAIGEIDEGVGTLARLRARLRGFLPGNWARSERAGTIL